MLEEVARMESVKGGHAVCDLREERRRGGVTVSSAYLGVNRYRDSSWVEVIVMR